MHAERLFYLTLLDLITTVPLGSPKRVTYGGDTGMENLYFITVPNYGEVTLDVKDGLPY
jgi:hypothetical protein